MQKLHGAHSEKNKNKNHQADGALQTRDGPTV